MSNRKRLRRKDIEKRKFILIKGVISVKKK